MAPRLSKKRAHEESDDEILNQNAEESEIDSDKDTVAEDSDLEDNGDDGDAHTGQELRLRQARKYLKRLGLKEAVEEEIDRVKEKLDEDANKAARRIQLTFHDRLEVAKPVIYRCASRSLPNCVAVSPTEEKCYTGGKNCAIYEWDVETGKKVTFPGQPKNLKSGGHAGPVLELHMIPKSHILVSGGEDEYIRFWDIRTPGKPAFASILDHKGAITGLASNVGGDLEQIISTSKDKTVRVWSLKSQSNMGSHFGHVGPITCLDILEKDRPVTGGEDRTMRFWNFNGRSHHIFNASSTVDGVSVLNPRHFVTGSQDGALALWSATKKKPIVVREKAHVAGESSSGWITSVASFRYGDMAVSGSDDGVVRFWHVKAGTKDEGGPLIEIEKEVCVPGCVNSIRISPSGRFLFMAVSREHKFGRWIKQENGINGVVIVPIRHPYIDTLIV